MIAYIVELALIDAIKAKAEYTPIGYIDGQIHFLNQFGYWEIR